jgi:phosphoribosylglycinamide formyltransferase-1
MEKKRLGILVSGRGSNLQALLDACAAPDFPARVAVVVSNVPDAFALERARKAGVAAEVLDHKSFADRAEFDAALAARLRAHDVEIVCLAGFMRVLGAAFLGAFPGRILNIHPSLLPAFPGIHGARQAVAHGAKISGCTVHFVDAGLDSGLIIVQSAVPVLPEDDEETLAARILEEEHRIYPLAVRWLCEGRVSVHQRTVRIDAEPVVEGQALRNPGRTR